MIAGGIGAGVFGSLLGLGGGILIVPLLTLGFGLPVREAAAVSLVSVIVTSSAAASVYLQRHTANLRLGMTLELFTAIGALAGGFIAFALSDRVLAGLFTVLLGYTAFTMARRRRDAPRPAPDAPVDAASDASAIPQGHGTGLSSQATLDRLSGPGYRVRNLGRGVVGAVFAGVVSAVLGVGGGIVKVPVMHLVMGVPLRVATATSNLMIGITATASAIVYVIKGGMDPLVVGPIAVGVWIGASIGFAPRPPRRPAAAPAAVHRRARLHRRADGTASPGLMSAPATPDPRSLDLDLAVARLLNAGTVVAVAILALGVVAMAVTGRSPLDTPVPQLDLARLPQDLIALRPEGFLWLGLIAVIATPLSRVVASLVGYVRQGERTMILISVAILSVIGASVVISLLVQ